MRRGKFYGRSDAINISHDWGEQQTEDSPSREIDSGRSDSGTTTEAIKTATVATADGSIDGKGVVGDAIALGTKVLDIAEDLVGGVGVEGGTALVSDVLHPVGICQLEEIGTHKECKGQDAHDERLVRDR